MCDRRAPCPYARGALRKAKTGKITNKEAKTLLAHFAKSGLSREFFAKHLRELQEKKPTKLYLYTVGKETRA